MMTRATSSHRLGRRAFLKETVLFLSASSVTSIHGRAGGESAIPPAPPVRFGLLTDLHYADKPPTGTRYYRETPAKLAEAAERFQRERPDFVVELGDLIDAADSVAEEQRYLERIDRDFQALSPHRHYVLGNHCVDTLTKNEFLGQVGQARSYYSFESGGYHFIVLDSCFRADGTPYGRKNFKWTDSNIPGEELDWLRADLSASSGPVIVFAHQRLDVGSPYGVQNAPEVRRVLEASGRVSAVFQGHSHKNDYHEIQGIHYVTLAAMIEGSGAENNGYALVEARNDGELRVQGFRRQSDYVWRRG